MRGIHSQSGLGLFDNIRYPQLTISDNQLGLTDNSLITSLKSSDSIIKGLQLLILTAFNITLLDQTYSVSITR